MNFFSAQAGRTVLVKGDESLWVRAEVHGVEGDQVFVKQETRPGELLHLSFEDVLPLEDAGDDESEEDEPPPTDPRLQPDIEEDFTPVSLDIRSAERLGEWEAHTRGLGSRLMGRMGWVPGVGLGKNGEGRVEPVPAMVYPQGRSLDWCMDLR